MRLPQRAARGARARDRTNPGLYDLERALQAQGCVLVAGVDEVGRGALAGPLTAAAVVLPARPRIEGLDDSKRLTPARREELAEIIHATAIAVSIAHVSAGDIDGLGVTAALKRAVLQALQGLGCEPDHVVIDGLPLRVVERETAVVKGDSKVAAIAAASIVAKVARDQLMRDLAPSYPEYGFEINKGYGTPEHLDAISRIGAERVAPAVVLGRWRHHVAVLGAARLGRRSRSAGGLDSRQVRVRGACHDRLQEVVVMTAQRQEAGGAR